MQLTTVRSIKLRCTFLEVYRACKHISFVDRCKRHPHRTISNHNLRKKHKNINENFYPLFRKSETQSAKFLSQFINMKKIYKSNYCYLI